MSQRALQKAGMLTHSECGCEVHSDGCFSPNCRYLKVSCQNCNWLCCFLLQSIENRHLWQVTFHCTPWKVPDTGGWPTSSDASSINSCGKDAWLRELNFRCPHYGHLHLNHLGSLHNKWRKLRTFRTWSTDLFYLFSSGWGSLHCSLDMWSRHLGLIVPTHLSQMALTDFSSPPEMDEAASTDHEGCIIFLKGQQEKPTCY